MGTQLILLRHGESVWNQENRFTGWADVDLSPVGIIEAQMAGKILRDNGYSFDHAYASRLKRGIRTLRIVLDEMELKHIPISQTWRLNERHYGALQGLNKAETVARFGEAQVLLWRRSYDIRPPGLVDTGSGYALAYPKSWKLNDQDIPSSESLKDTQERLLPYWHRYIAPKIRSGLPVIISAHGNSLRALVKYLDDISDMNIADLNIPTGLPLVYELDSALKPIKNYYLGDPNEIRKAIEGVANQGMSAP